MSSYIERFERIDKNKDGKISCDEFSPEFRTIFPTMSSEETDMMFKEVDVDCDGQIDVTEFFKSLMIGKEAVEKQLFDRYDIDRDGKISPGEVHDACKYVFGEKKSMEECARLVDDFDTDKDGFVSFEEFKTMLDSDKVLQWFF
ncbi:unnamed protein product [Eruca vesicaria subsp. sativa]|uniref:EF-hand domain-containing protein n=1 Tax=Eruca vesicaria subsp. sativa TaxID=29727 RepID=A0ABC8IWN6_ERUVS|nr:unnamed protein product [Eruca vesicaria subsp. sativa]